MQQPDRVSNRSNTPARANEPAPITPLEQASRMPILPTSRPRRAARRRGPINPVYILLLTLMPLVMIGVMVWAAAVLFQPSAAAAPQITNFVPANALATEVQPAYNSDIGAYKRDGDLVTVTGQVKNNSDTGMRDLTLKAFVYGTGSDGKPAVVGSGVGWAYGEIAPGATAPFTLTAHIGPGITTVAGTPGPAPVQPRTVQVLVDQVWAVATPTP